MMCRYGYPLIKSYVFFFGGRREGGRLNNIEREDPGVALVKVDIILRQNKHGLLDHSIHSLLAEEVSIEYIEARTTPHTHTHTHLRA